MGEFWTRIVEVIIAVAGAAASVYIFYKKTKRERELSNQLQTDKILASMKEKQEKELKAIEAQTKERDRIDGINAEQDKRATFLEYEIKETKKEIEAIGEQLHSVTATLESMQKDMHHITLTIQTLLQQQPRRRNARTD
jgi:seryl-tRNA synthetase